jgi:AraC-like DNA-binding protein
MQKIPSIKFKLFAAAAAGILLAGTLVVPSFTRIKIGFTGKDITAYADRTEKETTGNSEIFSVDSDSSVLRFSYVLRKGYPYPYAGITIPLGNGNSRFLDCSAFDILKIRIASSQLSDCKVYLRVHDRNVSRKDEPLSERYLYRELEVGPTPRDIAIPFKEFVTPDWWYQKNNITLSDAAPVDFSQVSALQLESGSTAKTGIVDTISIYGISCVQKPNFLIIGILAGLLAASAAFSILRLLPARKKQPPIVITYDKKELHNYRDMDARRISEYVAEHFSEPALSILTVGKSLGLSQKKIARVMNEEFTMSFKQYLTSIRVHEAKRLLQETDRLVFDIALAVGFNNISHFNRVFKNATQVSPLEFRSKKKAAVC